MTIPTPTIKRLVVYRRHLEELQKEGIPSIYSHDLAEQLGLTAAIVRKDISTLGSLGDINEGYNLKQLIEKINSILGTNKIKKIVLMGAGNIGKALLGYKGFSDRGFDIVKVFDTDKKKIGTSYNDKECLPLSKAPKYIKENKIKMAILATPKDATQEIAEQLVKAGIKSFLNFVPIRLNLPEGTYCESVDFTMKLEKLAYHVLEG